MIIVAGRAAAELRLQVRGCRCVVGRLMLVDGDE